MTLPNGKSKGCGIVEYATPQEAETAIEKLSNLALNGRPIFVREDRESENKASNPGPPLSARIGGGRFNSHNSSSHGNGGGSGSPTQVYVSNIPFSVNWKNLKDLFKIAGGVIRCDIFESQGRSKGTGVVLFETGADADNAIARLNGYEFHGRPLEVRIDKFFRPENVRGRFGSGSSRPEGGSRFDSYNGGNNGNAGTAPSSKRSPFTDGVKGDGPVSDTIFVSNLPWATTNLDLVELFQSVATVVKAEIQYEVDGRSAGAGVVKFDTPASAHIAVEKLNGYTYGNRSLQISFATYPPSGNGAAGPGEGPAGGSMDMNVPTAPATTLSSAPMSTEPVASVDFGSENPPLN